MDNDTFRKWCDVEVPVILTKLEILSIVGNIQLAVRHPENVGPTSKIVVDAGRKLAALIKNDDVIPPDVIAEWRKEGLV